MRAGTLWRLGKKFAAALTALCGEFVFPKIRPEGLGFELFEERFDSTYGSAATVFSFAHIAPNIKLACMHKLPPWPLTIPTLAFFT